MQTRGTPKNSVLFPFFESLFLEALLGFVAQFVVRIIIYIHTYMDAKKKRAKKQ
jgi:hypothetical protein